jgi:murein L,D-transpeptidase YafK
VSTGLLREHKQERKTEVYAHKREKEFSFIQAKTQGFLEPLSKILRRSQVLL